MVKFSFFPREEKFFDLIEGSARNMVKTAQGLKDLIENWQDIGGKLADITELEHEGDHITHKIIALLHRTFVTPFDREDIVLLANTMDDVTDLIHEAADVMVIYQVERPTGRAKELAGILLLATEEVARAVPHLRWKKELKNIPDHCIELNRLENLSDTAYRAALGELFEDSQDMGHIIKWREVYEHMESATDKCEDVANVLEGVALKHA